MWHIIAMGAGKRFSAHVPAGDDPADAICAALAASEDFSREAVLGEPAATRLQVVVEELVTNAFRHGAATSLSLVLQASMGAIDLTLDDDGAPFDPTAPVAFAGPDDETGGGVGLALVRAWSARWRYTRASGLNRSTLTLRS